MPFSRTDAEDAQSPDIIGLTSFNPANSERFHQTLEEVSLVSSYLYSDTFCHLVSSADPLAQQETVLLEDIVRYPFIYFTTFTEHSLHLQWRQIYSDFGIFLPPTLDNPPSLLTMTSLEAVKRLVADGCGIALLPRTALYQDLYIQSGRIVPVEVQDVQLHFEHYLLHHRQLQLTPAAQTLVTIIKHIYRQLDSQGGAFPCA